MDSTADSPLKSFFTEWRTYRLFKDANFLHHREVADILHRELAARRDCFTFLDLASGDASATAGFLRGTKVRDYTAVDFSKPALELASQNTTSLECPRHFFEKDFAEFAGEPGRSFDIVYLGLSIHHMPTARKRAILADLRRRTAPGGILFLYEPIFSPGETLPQLLPRWKNYLDTFPAPIPPEAREVIWNHVRTCDLPETLEDYFAAARAAGFPHADCLFTDPREMYSLMRFSGS